MDKDIKQKKHNYKKVILQVCLLLMVFLIITGILIAVISTIKSSGNLSFGQYKFYIMNTKSKNDIAQKGDFIIAKKIKDDELKIGDDVVYSNDGFYYCNRIIQTRNLNTVTKLVIAEDNGIKYQFEDNEIEGKIIFHIHNLGSIIIFFRTIFGIISFILLITCLFFLLRMILLYDKKCTEVNSTKDKI